MRDHAKRIKEHTLAHLDHYLEQLEASVQRLGGHVHWAATAEDARRIVLDIAQQGGCKRIVKSKSMTTEEMHLNPALEAAGLEVTETDFGEFIIQLAGERPSHLVAPAVHHTRESIARLLSEHTGETMAGRSEPRWRKRAGVCCARSSARADMGISGANFAVAETGTIVLISNEGNGRLTTTLPARSRRAHGHRKSHSAPDRLAGISEVAGASGHGTNAIGLHHIDYRAAPTGETDGPEEFHLVLLDNGRSRVLATPFRESLQCIRCGACLNACPGYRRIGGHAYGGVYSGPIGSILTPLYDSVSANPHLPHASSLCGACLAACPVKINIPHMLIGLRELQTHGKVRKSALERLGYGSVGRGVKAAVAVSAIVNGGADVPTTFFPRRLAQTTAGAGRGMDGGADFPCAGSTVVPTTMEQIRTMIVRIRNHVYER